MDDNLNVMDMVDQFAQDSEFDASEVFRRNPVSGNIKKELEMSEELDEEMDDEEEEEEVKPAPKKKQPWVPDPSLTADMKEFQQAGAVYDKSEIVLEENHELRNIADDSAIQESRESMDDMSRKLANIEDAKKRHKIARLHIPPGEHQVKMLIAASDKNYKRAQSMLDQVLAEIDQTYPEFIEYAEDAQKENTQTEQNVVQFQPTANNQTNENAAAPAKVADSKPATSLTELMDPDVKVTIDKRNVSQISWSEEEVSKIKKSRTVELNIVECNDIEFGSIEDVDTSKVDAVLAQYERKSNDVVAALPASKYRATFTGLTYPEVIDLSSSNEMNNLDGEWKKWSICFNHIKNQSIGPWEEYLIYPDPVTHRMTKISVGSDIPDSVSDSQIHHVTKFEDFLRKTSFMDLEFMLWKILCATSMDKEIVSIDCHTLVNGKACGNNYDWIYSPNDLLSVDTVSPVILDEMKETAEASGTKEVMKVYNSSPVRSNNYVKLHTSGFMPIYGHASAYEYLDEIYAKINNVENADSDPTFTSRAMSYTTLTTIKAFLIENKETGKLQRITGVDNMVKILDTLDEIDWQTITEITRMMLEPYQFKFSLRDIVCPKCKNRSIIPIDSMSRLLFIVARSLSSVQVTLRKQ